MKATFSQNYKYMNDYQKYIEIQQESENKYLQHIKTQSKEGHIFDESNRILISMLLDLNVRGNGLDIGCHSGYHTEQIKNLLGECIGIDINENLLNIAHNHNRNYCIYGDMHNLQFKDNQFDLIFSHEVLEHAIDLKKVLLGIHRILKQNGYLVFSVPSSNQPNEYKRGESDPHFSIKTPFEMKNLLIECGYKIVYGYIYNIPFYNIKEVWLDKEQKYNFLPHLHAVIQKI
jgi:ubiquinone/menaquinone biosynthesis C-methylase UbiE